MSPRTDAATVAEYFGVTIRRAMHLSLPARWMRGADATALRALINDCERSHGRRTGTMPAAPMRNGRRGTRQPFAGCCPLPLRLAPDDSSVKGAQFPRFLEALPGAHQTLVGDGRRERGVDGIH